MIKIFLIHAALSCAVFSNPSETKGIPVCDRIAGARFVFDGFAGNRIRANVENWLKTAPKKNPGLLDMFARRDNGKKPDLVPWAGEFVGKYLISGVQALRMCDDPELKAVLKHVVDRLLELQASDGYLGPWPKAERLLGHWDLWGHYHVMLALLMWHEHTGDEKALEAACRIGDLVCRTFLDTGRRVIDAGSPEMNMGVIHGLLLLYKKTKRDRYLRMAREVLKDFERAGDYYRTGCAGKEFYLTPKPRWESLHSLQGLTELYLITGDASFRRAFLSHWASIRRFDLRNTFGFSSGEAATGNPYTNSAIETCCVIAWQAVMIDALRLTGDSTIADDLEGATFNAVFGSQHPSGKWCTYSTPMNGTRSPSHVAIRFQARKDTPLLNCCSVNGPRGYGMLSEWGIMQWDDGFAVNYYGPMTARFTLTSRSGLPVTVSQKTTYPVGPEVLIRIKPEKPERFTVRFRIPKWSQETQVTVNGAAQASPKPGHYLSIDRIWKKTDAVRLVFDLRLRPRTGDLEQYRRVSLYRGPLLLALDKRFHTPAHFTLDMSLPLALGTVTPGKTTGIPWLTVDVTNGQPDRMLRLIDFASAGMGPPEKTGIFLYLSWLLARNCPPAAPAAWKPADRSRIGIGPIRFMWRPPADIERRVHSVVISESSACTTPLLRYGNAKGRMLVLPAEVAKKLTPLRPYFWKVTAENPHGKTESIAPYKQFIVDPDAPPMSPTLYGERETDKVLIEAALRGSPEPSYGKLRDAAGWKAAAGPGERPRSAVLLNGSNGMLRYPLESFPETAYSVSVWVKIEEFPKSRYGQIVSAWTAGMDDPLRVVVDRGKLAARIEAGNNYTTRSTALELHRWYHIAVVKNAAALSLFVDGKKRALVSAPHTVISRSRCIAIGGNPLYRGAPEYLNAAFAGFALYARALDPEEIKAIAARPK